MCAYNHMRQIVTCLNLYPFIHGENVTSRSVETDAPEVTFMQCPTSAKRDDFKHGVATLPFYSSKITGPQAGTSGLAKLLWPHASQLLVSF